MSSQQKRLSGTEKSLNHKKRAFVNGVNVKPGLPQGKELQHLSPISNHSCIDVLKANVDVAAKDGKLATRVVIRDYNGKVIASLARLVQHVGPVHAIETQTKGQITKFTLSTTRIDHVNTSGLVGS
ncbi:hypothetical protein M9H77_14399 [Catharanthus roseus]|uniref:Uncharacterized protein n=1 Tax=Catharanthus roseus TaxID=4058 RepID=A0ACC0BN03_CATRO|nr:hypothetical protein M9H77_14399 [Catharanthus roseus]